MAAPDKNTRKQVNAPRGKRGTKCPKDPTLSWKCYLPFSNTCPLHRHFGLLRLTKNPHEPLEIFFALGRTVSRTFLQPPTPPRHELATPTPARVPGFRPPPPNPPGAEAENCWDVGQPSWDGAGSRPLGQAGTVGREIGEEGERTPARPGPSLNRGRVGSRGEAAATPLSAPQWSVCRFQVSVWS